MTLKGIHKAMIRRWLKEYEIGNRELLEEDFRELVKIKRAMYLLMLLKLIDKIKKDSLSPQVKQFRLSITRLFLYEKQLVNIVLNRKEAKKKARK